MMRAFVLTAATLATLQAQSTVTSLQQVHRIYVAPLVGGRSSDPLREMLIAALDSTGLFVLTDDQTKADAVLKGAANQDTWTDSLDTDQSLSSRGDVGINSGFRINSGSGTNVSSSAADRNAHRIHERKQEAFATVRLVNQSGDTLWSTTQESRGAKFRSASTDVAAKVARQITLDMSRAGALGVRR